MEISFVHIYVWTFSVDIHIIFQCPIAHNDTYQLWQICRILRYTKEYQKRKVTNTLIPGTSFWLQCTHNIWVADGKYQTSTQLALTFKHLSHHGTKACILAWNNLEKSVCSQEITARFTSATAANYLPVSFFLRGSKKWKSLVMSSGLYECGL